MTALARAVLQCAEPAEKARLTHVIAARCRHGEIAFIGACNVPDAPAPPERPELRLPRDMPRRRAGGTERNRAALLHALAHIELNAIDLAWDLTARFVGTLPGCRQIEFVSDWIAVADDETRHFELLAARLAKPGMSYGELPAHAGLWQAAAHTSDDLLARLAVVPLVLEARALDVTPTMERRLRAAGDRESAQLLARILRDEIRHVATGQRWFDRACGMRGLDRRETYQALVKARFRPGLKVQFNAEARRAAGLDPSDYVPLADHA